MTIWAYTDKLFSTSDFLIKRRFQKVAKKIKIKPSRKELLKEEDEFISFTEQAFKWGTANWPIVIIALAVIVAVALIGIMLKSNLEKSKKNMPIPLRRLSRP